MQLRKFRTNSLSLGLFLFTAVFSLPGSATPVLKDVSGEILSYISISSTQLPSVYSIGPGSALSGSWLLYDNDPSQASNTNTSLTPFSTLYQFRTAPYGFAVELGSYTNKSGATVGLNALDIHVGNDAGVPDPSIDDAFLLALGINPGTYDGFAAVGYDPAYDFATNTGIAFGLLMWDPDTSVYADQSLPADLAMLANARFGITVWDNGNLAEIASGSVALSQPVPVPPALGLLGAGLLALGGRLRRRRAAVAGGESV